MIRAMGIEVEEVEKRLHVGSERTVVDIIEDGTVGAVVNTVTGDRTTMQDGFDIRRSAVMQRIPCFTSIDTARCAVDAEGARVQAGQSYNIKSLTEYLDGE
jgi:carbamoyl-phosphate synthase large subunit